MIQLAKNFSSSSPSAGLATDSRYCSQSANFEEKGCRGMTTRCKPDLRKIQVIMSIWSEHDAGPAITLQQN
jgi:hypothetical protein